MTRWTRAIDLLVETQNGFNDGGYPQHLACGDFMLRRHNHLLARLDAGRAAAMELCGAQPRHYSELERIHVGGPFHHRIDLSLQKRDHK